MILDTDQLLVQFRLPLLATGVYITLYYSWMFVILFAKIKYIPSVRKELRAEREKGDITNALLLQKLKSDPRLYQADRSSFIRSTFISFVVHN